MKGLLIGCGGGAYHGIPQMVTVSRKHQVKYWRVMDEDVVSAVNTDRQWGGYEGWDKAKAMEKTLRVVSNCKFMVDADVRTFSLQQCSEEVMEWMRDWSMYKSYELDSRSMRALIVVLADNHLCRAEGWRLANEAARRGEELGVYSVVYATAGCDGTSGWAAVQMLEAGEDVEYPSFEEVMTDVFKEAERERMGAAAGGRVAGEMRHSCGAAARVEGIEQTAGQTVYANARSVAEMWDLTDRVLADNEGCGCRLSIWHKARKVV